jgi:hypothetical protein
MFRKTLSFVSLLTMASIFALPACAAKLSRKNRAVLKDPIEVPYNETISAAFNGVDTMVVTHDQVEIYDNATNAMLFEYSDPRNELTFALYCGGGDLLPPTPACADTTNNYANDSRVKYDWAHNRWIVISLVFDSNNPALWFAASATSDPMGGWYVYEIPTCGWDQPTFGIDAQGHYATVVEDVCNSLDNVSNTFRVDLAAAESGTLSWFYIVNGASGISVFNHPVSTTGPALPNDDSQYTVKAVSETVNGVTYPGVSVGMYDNSTNSVNQNWKNVYIKQKSAAGTPMPHCFDAPGAPQGLCTQPIEADESGAISAWDKNSKQSLIFTGFPVENNGKYTVALFAVPAQTSSGSAHTLSFTPQGEVMAVTLHPCAQQGVVVVGAIETSDTMYPRLSEYTWKLADNTISGPLVVQAGNVTPTGYDAGRLDEFIDSSDCVNGIADIEGQVSDDTYQNTIDTYGNPYASVLATVQAN